MSFSVLIFRQSISSINYCVYSGFGVNFILPRCFSIIYAFLLAIPFHSFVPLPPCLSLPPLPPRSIHSLTPLVLFPHYLIRSPPSPPRYSLPIIHSISIHSYECILLKILTSPHSLVAIRFFRFKFICCISLRSLQMNLPAFLSLLFHFSFLFFPIPSFVFGHTCGNNRIPYGIEIYHNGMPSLLCSRPNCFEKMYADCDERATRRSCESNSTWVGGFDKGYGDFQPLYLQCCEFELLPALSTELYSNVLIRPGEYFEGEEIMDKLGEEVVAFDLITNLRKVNGGYGTNSKRNTSQLSYMVDIRRFHCDQMVRPKRYKPWKWP